MTDTWHQTFANLRLRITSGTRDGPATDNEIAAILKDHPNQVNRWSHGMLPRGEAKRKKILTTLRRVIAQRMRR